MSTHWREWLGAALFLLGLLILAVVVRAVITWGLRGGQRRQRRAYDKRIKAAREAIKRQRHAVLKAYEGELK